MLAPLNTLYDDIGFLTDFSLRALFYLSPVVYPASMVPDEFRGVFDLNPMSIPIEAYRDIILYGRQPDLFSSSPSQRLLVLVVTGLWIFDANKICGGALMNQAPTVQVAGVTKKFTIPTEVPRSLKEKIFNSMKGTHKLHTFQALEDIQFNVSQGETFGIVGANGSGKSTLFKLLCGVIMPDAGSIQIEGRISAIVELTAGFHAELTGRENIYLNGAIYGMSREQVTKKLPEIFSFADIGQFMDARIVRTPRECWHGWRLLYPSTSMRKS